MSEAAEKSRYWVPMVGNAFRVLDLFYDAEGEMGLRQVTTRTGITKSSAFRILFTLEELGYVARNPENGKYALGRRALEAATQARGRHSIVQVARPYMRTLHAHFGETVNLAVLEGRNVVYLETIEGTFAFRLSANVGTVAPIHASGLGKVILAFQPERTIMELVPKGRLPQLTARTVTSRPRLLEVLRKIRQQGYAFDDAEVENQVLCVAAPILNDEGRATHAISVSGPTHRMVPRRAVVISEVTSACQAISRKINEIGA